MKQHTLQLEGVTLDVLNQNLSSDEKYARLINGLTADFKSGNVYAFMGTSGSGKTTTLETIAGLVPSGSRTGGRILVDGQERNPDEFPYEFAYGDQLGYIIDELTVEEFVYYYVVSSLPEESKERVREKMDEVLENLLNIGHIRHNKMKNISGGEQKRANLARTFTKMLLLEGELKVVLLDEPTSELDAGLALKLGEFLRDYARRSNSIVLITVHQPGAELYNTFDNLLFMNNGEKLYLGPSRDFIKFLGTKGIHNDGGPETNMEFLFSLFTKGSKMSKKYEKQLEQIAKEMNEEKKKKEEKKLRTSDDTEINFIPNLYVSFQMAIRQIIIDWRNREILYSLAMPIAMALFLVTGKYIYKDFSIATIKASMLSLSLYYVMNPSGLMNDKHYVTEESNRKLYGAAEVWFSSLISDTLVSILKYCIFFGIIYAFGLISMDHAFLGQVLMYTLGGTVSSMLFRSIASPLSTLGKVFSAAMVFMFQLSGALLGALTLWISVIPEGSIPQEKIDAFISNFFDSTSIFSKVGSWVIRFICYVPKVVRSFLRILFLMFHPFAFFHSSILDAEKSSYKLFFLIIGPLGSLLLLSFIGISFLHKRFVPSVRFRLSDDDTLEDGESESRKKSHQFLLAFIVVLVVIFACVAFDRIFDPIKLSQKPPGKLEDMDMGLPNAPSEDPELLGS
ncbi:putative ABC-like lipid transport protein [Encephalitozoon cuniculi EcunIII-L]|nr:putative ABC-like lipid transport protein [Encephalitozoon cuniculi EcunIII-L]